MEQAQSYSRGKYAGTNQCEIQLDSVLLSETVYKKNTISDWHYHENPYFAFILNGGSTEVRKKGNIECLPGQAYFYNWEDVHRNKDYQLASRNFNVEFDKGWLAGLGFNLEKISGIISIANPELKLGLIRLFREYKINDGSSALSVQSLALELVSLLAKDDLQRKIPEWVRQIMEILNDRWSENISLKELSTILHVHPVTISRYFPKYVKCSFGEYIRRIRIERSLPMIRSSRLSLTEIAYQCGFTDQAHFIKTFKGLTHFLPNDFRRS